MTKSFYKITLLFVIFFSTGLVASLAVADLGTAAIPTNPGADPNLAISSGGANTEGNPSHCILGQPNYCEGCCQKEIQVKRDAQTAAITGNSAASPKSKDGGQ